MNVVGSSTNIVGLVSRKHIVGLGPVVESLPATKSCPSTHDQTVVVSHDIRVSSPLIAQPPLKRPGGRLPIATGRGDARRISL